MTGVGAYTPNLCNPILPVAREYLRFHLGRIASWGKRSVKDAVAFRTGIDGCYLTPFEGRRARRMLIPTSQEAIGQRTITVRCNG